MKLVETACDVFEPSFEAEQQLEVQRFLVDEVLRTGSENLLYRRRPSACCEAAHFIQAWAEWAAWLPCTCQVGRLVRQPGGLPRQTTYPVNRW